MKPKQQAAKNNLRNLWIVPFLGFGLLFTGCGGDTPVADGPVTVQYWEKWTGFEGEAMVAVVDRFNTIQNDIFVELTTVSQIDRKVLVATAGGDPPDIAGLFSFNVYNYAELNALMPLDDFIKQAGIKAEDYIPAYWRLCLAAGKVYALPTTPASIGLHWNKRMFREAGLDPERPPRTIEELDYYAKKLTVRDEVGKIVQVGFLPIWPGWWNWAWGLFFGGELWDGGDTVTPDDSRNIIAYEWVQKYSRGYGLKELQTFRSGFGNFSSPQNPFLSEQVAMVLQGVWMYNFIDMYAPDLEWGAAPFPTSSSDLYGTSICEADVLVIPSGSRHPREAFEFIKYVNTQAGMELLCMGQRKHTPLRKVSKEFLEQHPNPYIEMFIELAKNPNAKRSLAIGIWNEYDDEMRVAFDRIWLQEGTAAEILGTAKRRLQKSYDRELRRKARLLKDN